MKSSVIVFPGSNCDRDIAVALEKFKIDVEMNLKQFNNSAIIIYDNFKKII